MPVYPSTGVQVGDIRMYAYDDQPPDAYGVYWGLTQLEGWDDGWEGNAALDQRPTADGGWPSPQYAVPRVIQLGGTIEADTYDDATRAFQRLLAQLPFRQLGSITVSEGEGTVPEMTALVRQHGKPMLPGEARLGGYAEFSLSLIAPDPRKYDTTARTTSLVLPITSGGLSFPITFPITFPVTTTRSQATLTNDGNVLTYPTMVLVGPCPPASIANLTTGERMKVLDAVPADQSLVIDVLEGTATNGGQSRRVAGSWWGLVPGVNEVALSADTYDAAAQLLVSYRSAWK